MDIDKAFAVVAQRAQKLLLTPSELAAQAGVSRTAYWRATCADLKKRTKDNARIRVLRKLKAKLDEIERERGK